MILATNSRMIYFFYSCIRGNMIMATNARMNDFFYS